MSYFEDRIFFDGDPWCLPCEKASVPGYVKHVHCSGSRDHVLSYEGWTSRKPGSYGDIFAADRCSVQNCIVNLEHAEILAEHGYPAPPELHGEAVGR